jgi:hypothetical protein
VVSAGSSNSELTVATLPAGHDGTCATAKHRE